MSALNRRRTVARLPLTGLSLLVALVLVFAVACGGEDDPTATPLPAAQPAATSAPAQAEPTATSAPDPTATATTAAPTATVAATATSAPAPAATPTTDSSYDDYPEPSEDATEEPMAAEEVAIPIQGFQFRPAEITVPVGTTITWTNMDSAPHSATADDGSFNTGLLGENESASVTFDTPGTFTYFCLLHPSMTATVIVTN